MNAATNFNLEKHKLEQNNATTVDIFQTNRYFQQNIVGQSIATNSYCY